MRLGIPLDEYKQMKSAVHKRYQDAKILVEQLENALKCAQDALSVARCEWSKFDLCYVEIEGIRFSYEKSDEHVFKILCDKPLEGIVLSANIKCKLVGCEQTTHARFDLDEDSEQFQLATDDFTGALHFFNDTQCYLLKSASGKTDTVHDMITFTCDKNKQSLTPAGIFLNCRPTQARVPIKPDVLLEIDDVPFRCAQIDTGVFRIYQKDQQSTLKKQSLDKNVTIMGNDSKNHESFSLVGPLHFIEADKYLWVKFAPSKFCAACMRYDIIAFTYNLETRLLTPVKLYLNYRSKLSLGGYVASPQELSEELGDVLFLDGLKK